MMSTSFIETFAAPSACFSTSAETSMWCLDASRGCMPFPSGAL